MMIAAAAEEPPTVAVRTVPLDSPWLWLSKGWQDLVAAPEVGIAWGALFALIGFGLFFGLDSIGQGALILPLTLGFTLVGQVAAVGLYEVSRRLAAGQDNGGLRAGMVALKRNPAQITLVGLFLTIAFAAWVRLAMLEFALFFGAAPPAPEALFGAVLGSDAGFWLLAVGTVTGGLIAACVFAMTVIAVPMLVDRPETDAMTAMLASVEAVRANPKPMALWAFLIGLFTLAGLAFFLVGVVVTLPLLGHASWHAYRDLVEE